MPVRNEFSSSSDHPQNDRREFLKKASAALTIIPLSATTQEREYWSALEQDPENPG